MGGFATHAIFGKEVLEEISDELLASVIRKHRGVFGIGCQGPDLFLYNIAMLLSVEEKNLGLRMHREGSSRYFAWLMQTIWELDDPAAVEVGLSYLYGALAHYTLDSMLHPYIYARIGYDVSEEYSNEATGGMHHRLESAIDAKMLVVKEGILPSSYNAGESLQIDGAEKRILAEILSKAVSRSYRIGLREENVTASLCMMNVIARGFFAASQRQRRLLQKVERPFFKNYGLSNFMVTDDLIRERRVMNTANCVWRNPWDKMIASSRSVWEIYDDAVVQYQVYCGFLGEVLPYYKRKWLLQASPGMLYRRLRRSDWQRGAKWVYKERSSDIMKQGKEEKSRGNVIGIFAQGREDKAMYDRIVHVAEGIGNLSYDSGLPCREE